MSRTITPTYRVEYFDNTRQGKQVMAWRGRVTQARLEKWRQDYNKSFASGGVNYHLTQAFGFVLHIHRAQVVRQSTGEVVTTVSAPAFEAI